MADETNQAAKAALTGRKAVMIIASSEFRDEELFTPLEHLRSLGATVQVACRRASTTRGVLGRAVTPDITLDKVNAADCDAVIFVGGPGAAMYFKDPAAHKLAQDAAKAGKVLAAICIAPAILANAGVLKGKQATCFPSERVTLAQGGARYQQEAVVRDGNVITADGPRAAAAFAAALAEALK